ncbi:MAG TPA: hypothetical protein VF490_07540 [Chryseosolibacter sp.]
MNLLIIDNDVINNCTHIRVAETSRLFTETRCVHKAGDATDFLHMVCKGILNVPDLILINPGIPGVSLADFLQKLSIKAAQHCKQTAVMILPKPRELAGTAEPAPMADIKLVIPRTPALRYIEVAMFSLSNLAMFRANLLPTICSCSFWA